MNSRTASILIFLLFLLIASFLLSLVFGSSRLPFLDVLHALFYPDKGIPATMIVWQVRIPRSFLAVLVGAGLSVAGCIFQGLLRNPLADPYTLGISGGAALGSTVAMTTGLQAILGNAVLPAGAFLGAFLSIVLTYSVARRQHFAVPTLILGGVILSYLFSALVVLILSLSSTEKIAGAIIWLMGDLSATETEAIKIAAFPIVSGIISVMFLSGRLNILTLGEEKATYLGLNPESQYKIFFVIASLITGSCVAVSGLIGFVGLIIPHFFRHLVGPNHHNLLPTSAIGGGIFLLSCDTMARTIVSPMEVPVGVITGVLGGLFFLYYISTAKKWGI